MMVSQNLRPARAVATDRSVNHSQPSKIQYYLISSHNGGRRGTPVLVCLRRSGILVVPDSCRRSWKDRTVSRRQRSWDPPRCSRLMTINANASDLRSPERGSTPCESKLRASSRTLARRASRPVTALWTLLVHSAPLPAGAVPQHARPT
jgi:hypothetical protein